MILSLLFPLLMASPLCKHGPAVNKNFKTIKEKVNKKIENASHLVTIAQEADNVLSKLISKKSPILVNWIEKRNLMSSKEEVIASRWRTYYLKNFILSKYPTPKPSINASVEKLFLDINTLVFPDKEKKRISQVFQKAKNDSVAYIKNLNISNKSKKEILDRLNPISLFWFQSLKGSRFQNKPLEFLRWGLAYDPSHNQINVGIDVQKYANEETLYAVFAHEMGHAIDACRWSAFLKTENPFKKLYSCLRTAKSTGAKKRDDSKMDQLIKQKRLSPEMAQSLKENPFCNRSFYPPVGTQKEQVLEVFADWFSAEVLAFGSIQSKALRSDLCLTQELSQGSSYLPNSQRLQRIYSVQPKLKTLLGLQSPYQYCSL